MGFLHQIFLFILGGGGYVGLELLWRGRSHISMFLAGGLCFLLLGRLRLVRLSPALKGILGAAVITGVELLIGLLVNRDFRIWDYRRMPFHFMGQVCLSYSLLWIPVSLGAMGLHRLLSQKVRRQ